MLPVGDRKNSRIDRRRKHFQLEGSGDGMLRNA